MPIAATSECLQFHYRTAAATETAVAKKIAGMGLHFSLVYSVCSCSPDLCFSASVFTFHGNEPQCILHCYLYYMNHDSVLLVEAAL